MEKKIYTTTNYSMFKRLEGNRPIKDSRVDKIVQSISSVGYITSPILVNEKMEVIDGQGRLSALERLNLPVEYIVHEGVGVEECRQMNIHQSNWSAYDYVQSYACLGDRNYANLQSLLDTIDLPQRVIFCSLFGLRTDGGHINDKINRGQIECSDKDCERVRWECSYASNFKQVAANVGGRSLAFYIAVIYAYRHLTIQERQRLEEVVRKHSFDIPAFTKPGDFLRYFDEFYNKGLTKAKRIHLSLEWQTDTI